MPNELKPCPRKGDIVRNPYAGEKNPLRDFLYLGKGTIKQGRYVHKTYKGIAYNGEKVDVMRDTPLEIIGHMAEFDDFVEALKKLNRRANDEQAD